MRAALIRTLDGPSAIEIVDDHPAPTRGDDEILIEVHSVGLNFPDLLQTRGLYQYRPDLPYVPGSEAAGIVLEAPAGSPLRAGDRVVGIGRVGAVADAVAVPAEHAFPLPDGMSFAAAAALPLNYLTSYFALVERGRLAPGDVVLVHGAAGGVGIASIQIARAFGAGRVIAVTSTEQKGTLALDAGADEYVLSDGFLDAVGRKSVDVVLDPVGGDRVTDSLRALREFGRLLVVGFTAGDIPSVKLNRLLLDNLDVVGVGWGAYTRPKPGGMQRQWAALWPHLESGLIAPVIGGRFTMDATAAALGLMDTRGATWKLVIDVRP